LSKVISISEISEVNALEAIVLESMNKSKIRLTDILNSDSGLNSFAQIKFKQIGFDPLNPNRPLNLVEQVNQSFTYLATFKALSILFDQHPDLSPFTINLGTASGSDIESDCGSLAAEVFAAVSPSSNQKLKKDIDKVSATNAKYMYSFLMCPGIEPGRQLQHERERVRVWAL